MFYRLKNKKGFTLIELIVVIAILGILALIAIPRFAGFTDRAKIQADKQYAALVGNSAAVLLATNDFEINTAVDAAGHADLVIDADSGDVSITAAHFSKGAATFEAELLKLLVAKKFQYYTAMTVRIMPDGQHSIQSSTPAQ